MEVQLPYVEPFLCRLQAGLNPYPDAASPCPRQLRLSASFDPLRSPTFHKLISRSTVAQSPFGRKRDSMDLVLLECTPYASRTPDVGRLPRRASDALDAMGALEEPVNPDLFNRLTSPHAKTRNGYVDDVGAHTRSSISNNARRGDGHGALLTTTIDADDTRGGGPRTPLHSVSVSRMPGRQRVQFFDNLNLPNHHDDVRLSLSDDVKLSNSPWKDPLAWCAEALAALPGQHAHSTDDFEPHVTHATAQRRAPRSQRKPRARRAAMDEEFVAPLCAEVKMEVDHRGVEFQCNGRRVLPPRQARINALQLEEDSSDEELRALDDDDEDDDEQELDDDLDAAEGLVTLTGHHVGGFEDNEPAVRARGAEPAISRETLWALFRRTTIPTLKQAARMLGVGATQLKRICRVHGINRWPKRLLDSARSTYEHHEQAGNVQEARKAREELERMLERPGEDMSTNMNQLRQKKFKQCHKARKHGGRKGRRASVLGVRQ